MDALWFAMIQDARWAGFQRLQVACESCHVARCVSHVTRYRWSRLVPHHQPQRAWSRLLNAAARRRHRHRRCVRSSTTERETRASAAARSHFAALALAADQRFARPATPASTTRGAVMAVPIVISHIVSGGIEVCASGMPVTCQ